MAVGELGNGIYFLQGKKMEIFVLWDKKFCSYSVEKNAGHFKFPSKEIPEIIFVLDKNITSIIAKHFILLKYKYSFTVMLIFFLIK